MEVEWSELDENLLGEVMEKLSLTDRARCHAVCKSWRHIYPINNIPKSNIVSMFICLDRYNQNLINTLELGLYDPLYSTIKPILTYTISSSTFGIPLPSSRKRIRIFSKKSWLFISVRTKFSPANLYFLLISPLTKKIKRLEPLSTSHLNCFEQTFTTNPESADCVYLLLDTCKYDDRFIVATYRNGDKDWIVRKIMKDERFKSSVCVPMYAQGNFYFVSPFGQVMLFSFVEKKSRFESLCMDEDFYFNEAYSNGKYRVFMLNGDIMYSFKSEGNLCTKRYDVRKKVWILVSNSPHPVLPITSKPANMVEFFDSGCLVCASNNLDLVETIYNSLELKFNSGSADWNRKNSLFWLEPPVVK